MIDFKSKNPRRGEISNIKMQIAAALNDVTYDPQLPHSEISRTPTR